MMKRLVSLLIASCLCLSLIPATVFADTDGEVGNSGEVCNLLIFGDSTTNGFGLPDHILGNNTYAPGNSDLEGSWTLEKAKEYNSDPSHARLGRLSNAAYPWKLKKYIESTEGVSRCDVTPLCLDGLMTDSLRAMLDPDYYEKCIAYERELLGKGGGPVDSHVSQYIKNLYNGNAIAENTYDALNRYTLDEVKKADVLVLDTCMNSISLYLFRRVTSLVGIDIAGGKGYYKQKISDIADISGLSDKNLSRLTVLEKEVLDYLGDPDDKLTKGIVEAILYTYANCVTNFTEDLKLIRSLNPDAKIIVPGLYTAMRGDKVTIGGKEMDLGKLNEMLVQAINAYIRAIDDNSPNYYFADTPLTIHNIEDQFQEAESFEDFVASERGRHYLNALYIFLGDIFCPDPTERAYYKERIQNLFAEAIHNYPINIAVFASDEVDMAKVTEELDDYLKNEVMPSAATMACVHAMASQLLLHPSEKGCDQRFEAIRDAYGKDNTAYEEVLIGIVDAVKAAASKAGISSIDDLKKIAALKDLASLITKEDLLKIAQSIYDLPDFEAQIQQYMDEHSGEDAGKTEDRIASLEAQIDILTAIIEKLTQEAEKKESALAKAKITKVKPAKKALTVKWKAVANASGYQIYYKTSGKKAVIKTVKGAKKLTLKLTRLKKKAKYTVKVRAYKVADGKTTYGKWSAAKKAKTR